MVLEKLRKTVNNGNTSKNKLIKPNSKHLMTGTAIFIAAILVISGTNIKAFADNVIDTVDDTAGSTASITLTSAGETGSVKVGYRVQALPAAQDGVSNGCNGPVTVTISTGTQDVKVKLATVTTPATQTSVSVPITVCGQEFLDQHSAIFESSKPGTYPMQVTASGSGIDISRIRTLNIVVTGPANTAPTLVVPTGFSVEGNTLGGANVEYSGISADDAEDGDITSSVQCTPASGSFFALGGPHTVSCSVTDSGGKTATGSFSVTVLDTTSPSLSLPGNILREAEGPSGATVTYSATATDVVDSSPVVNCIPASGSTFGLGTKTVHCTAIDSSGNSVSGEFDVTVADTKPPEIATNADLTVGATSSSGAVVTYSNPAATDLVDTDVAVSCSPASGQTFPIGIKTVTCTATDDSGNSAQSTFKVTVNIPSVQFPLPPVNPDDSSTYKRGSTIPFKLKVPAAFSDLIITLIVSKTGPADGDPVNEAASTVPPTDGTTFRWDSTGQQFIYNLASKNLNPGAYKAWAVVNNFAIVEDVGFTIRN